MGANATLPESGANVNSPITGTIVRWRVIDAEGGPLRLRVLEPAGGSAYKAVGTSAGEIPTSLGTQTFETSLPIKVGDTVAIENTNATDTLGIAAKLPAAFFFGILHWLKVRPGPPPTAPETELGFNADVQPPPGISSISPSSGMTTGGTSVVIAGHDFIGATAVKFGSTPATSFTVNSETQITATTPATTTPGAVDTSVTTPSWDDCEQRQPIGSPTPRLRSRSHYPPKFPARSPS